MEPSTQQEILRSTATGAPISEIRGVAQYPDFTIADVEVRIANAIGKAITVMEVHSPCRRYVNC